MKKLLVSRKKVFFERCIFLSMYALLSSSKKTPLHSAVFTCISTCGGELFFLILWCALKDEKKLWLGSGKKNSSKSFRVQCLSSRASFSALCRIFSLPFFRLLDHQYQCFVVGLSAFSTIPILGGLVGRRWGLLLLSTRNDFGAEKKSSLRVLCVFFYIFFRDFVF